MTISTLPAISDVRKAYPVLQEYTYLNTPATGIIHPQVRAVADAANEKMALHGTKYREEWMFEQKAQVRETVAQFINAPVEGIALSQNFSLTINMLAEMMQGAGRKATIVEGDYPSLTMPFKVRTYEVEEFKLNGDGNIDYEGLERHLVEHQSDILAISHVLWSSGLVIDLEKISQICKRVGAISVVDATQSAGVLPIDWKAYPVDVLAASTYKWSGAGFGNGFAYIDAGLLDQFEPKTAGFNSFLWKDGKPYYEPNIRCFEPGHHDHEAFLRLQKALNMQMDFGQKNIVSRVRTLVDYFYTHLQDHTGTILYDFRPQVSGSILFVKGDQKVLQALEQEKILVSARGKGLRLGLHYYNNHEDVDRFVEAYLKQLGQ